MRLQLRVRGSSPVLKDRDVGELIAGLNSNSAGAVEAANGGASECGAKHCCGYGVVECSESFDVGLMVVTSEELTEMAAVRR